MTTVSPARSAAADLPGRADARENRARLLTAARDLVVERGADVPLEEVARRAGCGIATLYRRFPDRQALLREVVVDALRHTIAAAEVAMTADPDPFDALVRYMHAVLDIRTAAVIPPLLPLMPELDDPELVALRERGAEILQALITAAHRSGGLRGDVTFGDVGTLVVRVSRPLPGPFTRDQNDAMGHRHLDLLVDGLRARPASATSLSGTAMSREDLRRLPGEHPDEVVTR